MSRHVHMHHTRDKKHAPIPYCTSLYPTGEFGTTRETGPTGNFRLG